MSIITDEDMWVWLWQPSSDTQILFMFPDTS